MTDEQIIQMGVQAGLIKAVSVVDRPGYVMPGVGGFELTSPTDALEALRRFLRLADTHPAPAVPEELVSFVLYMKDIFVPMTWQQQHIARALDRAYSFVINTKAQESL